MLDNGWDTAPDFAERVAAAETAISEAERDGRPVSLRRHRRARGRKASPRGNRRRRQAPPRSGRAAPLPARPAGARDADHRSIRRSVPSKSSGSPGSVDGGDSTAFAAAAQPRRRQRQRAPIGAAGDRTEDAGKPGRRGARAGHAPTAEAVKSASPASTRRAGASSRARQPSTAAVLAQRKSRCRPKSAMRSPVSAWPAKDAPALFSSSTRAGSASPSASSQAKAPTPRSRSWNPSPMSSGRSPPRRTYLPTNAPSTSEAVTGLIDRGASIIVLTETGTLPPDTTDALRQLDPERRHAAPLRQPQPRGHYRRLRSSRCGSAGRARARRLALLGGAAADRKLSSPTARSPISPFPTDVRVNRQVLADPDALRDAEVWAELRDGTPLVTAATREEGPHRALPCHRRSALVEPAALRRVRGHAERHRRHGGHGAAVDRSETEAEGAQAAAAPWRPVEVLDGYGDLAPPRPARRLSPTSRTRRPSAADAARPLRSRRHGLRTEHGGRRQRACSR